MSIEQLDAAMLIGGLEAPAKPVLLALAWHHNSGTDRCFPSYETLAQDTGYCERSVIRAVKHLATLGLVTVTERKVRRPNGSKTNTSNEYTLNLGARAPQSSRVTVSHPGGVTQSPYREGIGNILPGDFSSRGGVSSKGVTGEAQIVPFPGRTKEA